MNTGGTISERNKALLRAICEQHPITRGELRATYGDAIDSGIETLQRHGLIESDRTDGGMGWLYEPTRRGRMMIEPPKGSGVIAAPRQPVGTGLYTGQRWNIRETGLQHHQHCSRRGEKVVPHMPVICLGSKVQDTKFR